MKIRSLFTLFFLFIVLCTPAQEARKRFTAMEANHVRVTTPELFAQSNRIEILLHRVTDTAYSFPLPGAKVISPYGRRRRHSGIDIKTHAKDTIRSAFTGIVRMSKPYSAYGNVIVVRHAFGLETIYSHNYKNLVQCGDTVRAGQPIALVGRTGRATTDHLHFETRVNGHHFDPTLVFDMNTQTLNRVRLECTKSGNGITVKALPAIGPEQALKKYPLELPKCPNVSLHLQTISLKERIEL